MPAGITRTDSMFSVREMPWHGLGAVLDTYPSSVDDALDKAGLGWRVSSGDVLIVKRPEWVDDFGVTQPAELAPAQMADGTTYKANIREDTGDLIGIVQSGYTVVDNRDAFRFLDALINGDMYFETAGSLSGGRRVWVLARLPEYVEVGGDQVATYVYVANSHDGSMAVTAAVTPVRIVCANTLGAALRAADRNPRRVFRFRHSGDLTAKYEEARQVMNLTVNYEKQFKVVGDKLAAERFTSRQFEKTLKQIFPESDDMGKVAKNNRVKARELVLATFNGNGPAGDTTGNAPRTKWSAYNAVGEYADWQRQYTKRTNQVSRSFEDDELKQRAFDLLVTS